MLDMDPAISMDDGNLVTRRGFTKYVNKQNFVHDDQEQMKRNGSGSSTTTTTITTIRSSVSGYSPTFP